MNYFEILIKSKTNLRVTYKDRDKINGSHEKKHSEIPRLVHNMVR